jgi:hypothetical protein
LAVGASQWEKSAEKQKESEGIKMIFHKEKCLICCNPKHLAQLSFDGITSFLP